MTMSKKTITNAITKFKEYEFLHKDDVVTSWSNTVSNSKYPTEKLVKDSLDAKANSSDKVTTLSSSSTDVQYPSAKAVYDALSGLDTGSGSYIDDYYFDATNKEIVLEYTNGSGGGIGGGSVDIATSWGSPTSDDLVPSEKLVKDSLDLKSDSSHTHSNYVNPTIADNLTTNDSSQVLSAKQGKILNDLIGQAITYINQ